MALHARAEKPCGHWPERIDLVDSFVIDEVATYPAFHKKVFLQEAE